MKSSTIRYTQWWKSKLPTVRNKIRRTAHLKHRYGITYEYYEQMLTLQRGVCAICKGVNKNGKRLSIDHDHNTKRIRKLLCNPCNVALGLMQHDALRLRLAAKYIDKHDNG